MMLGHLHCCLFLSALTVILGVVLLLLLWPGFLRLQVDRLFSCCWLQLRSSLLCGESKTTGALHWAHCIPATTQHILSIYLSTQRFERECLLLTLISSQRTSPWITATARPTGWHAGARMTKGESQLRLDRGPHSRDVKDTGITAGTVLYRYQGRLIAAQQGRLSTLRMI